MSETVTRTGSFPAINPGDRPSPPPPPPPGTPAYDAWVQQEVRAARRDSAMALEGIGRIEESLGYSPDAARGIKEGKGLLGQLSVLIEQNTRRETTASNRRYMLVGVSITLGIVLSLFGVLKAVGEIIRPPAPPPPVIVTAPLVPAR